MRIAVFGGSFDPPHTGHMMACYFLLGVHGADEVWLVPVFNHPFAKPLSPYEKRVEMCRLAAVPFRDRVKVDTIESEMGEGPVYTVDLLAELRRRHPEHSFAFVVGSDTLAESRCWKDFDKIQTLAELIVLQRRGSADSGKKTPFLLPELSSTQIRNLLGSGSPADGLVPASVLDYLKKEGLYSRR